jgi:hypothetical protein
MVGQAFVGKADRSPLRGDMARRDLQRVLQSAGAGDTKEQIRGAEVGMLERALFGKTARTDAIWPFDVCSYCLRTNCCADAGEVRS